MTNPAVTYSSQVGRWQRVGSVVHFELRVQVATISGGSGNLRVGGLPLPAAPGSNVAAFVSAADSVTIPSGRSRIAAFAVANTTQIALAGAGDGVTLNNLSPANLAPGSLLLIAGAYFVGEP